MKRVSGEEKGLVYTGTCTCIHGGQKMVLSLLELELQATVSCHVGARN